MAPFDLNGWGVGAQDVGWPTPTPTPVGLAEVYSDGHSNPTAFTAGPIGC